MALKFRSVASVLLAQLEVDRLEVARLVGCSRSAVGHWITGHARPSGDARTLLERELGIAAELWIEEAEPVPPAFR